MAGGLKHIKDHIKAVGNIQKITTSMKMISATRFLQAEKNLLNARPLGLAAKRFYDLNPLSFDTALKKTHLCPIVSDKGLCGVMPTKICTYVRKKTISRIGFSLICVGEKVKLNLSFDMKDSISLVINGVGHRTPTFKDASLIADYLTKDVEFTYGKIIFGRFINMAAFYVDELPVYTVPIVIDAQELHVYNNEDELDDYLAFSVASLFYYSLSESYAVEQSCRLNAMTNASKNAGKLRKTLNVKFNRLRQSVVTTQIIDIISGAQVVSAK